MKRRDVLIILASIFIFVFIWIGFNIYHNSVKSTISDSVSIQISPLSPSFDTNVIDKLKKRQSVTSVYQTTANELPPNQEIQPVVTPPIIGTGSATQEASPEGSLLQ